MYKDILLDSFNYCRKQKGLELYAYVIMSNHVHLIARAKNNLSDVVRDFKKFTSIEMLKVVDSEAESRRLWMKHQFAYYASRHGRNDNYQIWAHSNHPEALYTADMTMTKLHYIHENPVRASWVILPEHYLYSSAADYSGGKGLIEIDFL